MNVKFPTCASMFPNKGMVFLSPHRSYLPCAARLRQLLSERTGGCITVPVIHYKVFNMNAIRENCFITGLLDGRVGKHHSILGRQVPTETTRATTSCASGSWNKLLSYFIRKIRVCTIAIRNGFPHQENRENVEALSQRALVPKRKLVTKLLVPIASSPLFRYTSCTSGRSLRADVSTRLGTCFLTFICT